MTEVASHPSHLVDIVAGPKLRIADQLAPDSRRLRADVHARLQRAAAALRDDCSFLILDALRTQAQQFNSWNLRMLALARQHPALDLAKLIELCRRDIADPVNRPSGHQGGAAIDVTLVENGVTQRGDERVHFNIETKLSPLEPSQTLPPQAFARALIAEVRRAGMAGRTSIQSFDWRTLQVVQQEAPEIPTVYLSTARTLAPVDGKPTPCTAGIDPAAHGGSVPRMVRAAGGKVWSPSIGALTAAQVAEAHALCLNVMEWTVNDEATITRMLDLGVDGIISDRPDRVAQELQRSGMRWR
jgi:glycerophosphoryl diester phosphodiesterase